MSPFIVIMFSECSHQVPQTYCQSIQNQTSSFFPSLNFYYLQQKTSQSIDTRPYIHTHQAVNPKQQNREQTPSKYRVISEVLKISGCDEFRIIAGPSAAQLQLDLFVVVNNLYIVMYLVCLSQIQKHFKDVLLNSGRMVFRLGRYHECVATEGMDYQLASIGVSDGDNSGIGLYMGFCLPEKCSAQLVKSALNQLISKARLPMQVLEVRSHIPEDQEPYTWGFMFTITLMTFLLSLVLVSTFSKTVRSHKYLSAFSLQSSMKTYKYHAGGRLNVLNGVRALAMMWVVFGHTYFMLLGMISNPFTWTSKLESWFMLLIEGGFFAVDTFFFVGGFLVAFVFLRERSNSNLKYPLAILNRYLRLFPSYFLTILIYYTIFPHMGSGPLWRMEDETVAFCDNMWRPLLFVDNLVNGGNTQCMVWGWYLQNDMQMFVYSILLLLIYSKSRFWGYMSIVLSMTASFAYTMQVTFDRGFQNITHITDMSNQSDYGSLIYFKPWSRCPPYLYGLFLGLLYMEFTNQEKKNQHAPALPALRDEEIQEEAKPERGFLLKIKDKFEANAWLRRGCEILGILLGLFLLIIPRTAQGEDHHWPQFVHSVYLTYGKFGFVFSLSLIILPSLMGIKSLVAFTLDTKFFNWVAKASFCTYLIHLTLMSASFGSFKIDFYYDFKPLYTMFVSFLAISLFSGFLLSLLIQIPCSNLQRMWFKKLQNKKVKAITKQQKEDISKGQMQHINKSMAEEEPLIQKKNSIET